MKRYTMPKWWPLEKKTFNYVTTSRNGPHKKNKCLPLGVVLRDIFSHAKNMKEAIKILNKNYVKIDGVIRKDRKFTIGLMDIVQIADDFYRVMPAKKGFDFMEIKSSEKSLKLVKLEGKTYLKKGKLQLNFYDGKNIIVKDGDYSTGDTIIYDIEKKSIIKTLKMKVGSIAIISEGKNKGNIGKIKKIIKTLECGPNIIVLETEDKDIVTQKNQIYIIGEEKIEITTRSDK